MEERLQKLISAAGLMSRRAAEDLISRGKVTVNGKTASLGDKADPESDRIEIAGKLLRERKNNVYVMLNKPAGYVTTLSDEQGRKTVAELVKAVGTRLYPVGRLDLNSDGLLLMTNDGDIANRLMHPSGDVVKKYRLTVKNGGNNFEEAVKMLSQPLEIDGRLTSPAQVELVENTGEKAILNVSISEGRNRQIRRLCENAGLKVLRLTRIAEGPLELDGLPSGRFRYLTDEEIQGLKSLL